MNFVCEFWYLVEITRAAWWPRG